VVQAVLDRAVREPGRAGLLEGEAGDRVHGHGPPSPTSPVQGLARDLDDLRGVWEPEPVDGDGLEGAELTSLLRHSTYPSSATL
jgi:hypothetical protein